MVSEAFITLSIQFQIFFVLTKLQCKIQCSESIFLSGLLLDKFNINSEMLLTTCRLRTKHRDLSGGGEVNISSGHQLEIILRFSVDHFQIYLGNSKLIQIE